MPYFDANATTPLQPAVREAMDEALDEAWQNPSSPFRAGARVRARLELAREELAERLGVDPPEIVFTSGATESNNAVLRHAAERSPDGWVAVSAVEHPCVLEAARAYFGDRVRRIPVAGDGRVDPDAADAIVAEGPALVCLMAANNETGVLQPWREVAHRCRARGVPIHCDAVQWLGKLPASGLAGCDYVVGSAHKIGGPKGVGFLRVPVSDPGLVVQYGGAQESGHRGGTENYPAVAGFLAAWRTCAGERGDLGDRERMRGDAARLLEETVPGTRLVGSREAVLWNTIMVVPPRFANHRWVSRLDRAGFQASTGSACATGKEGPSHVLGAMGFEPEEARRSIRFSGTHATGIEHWRELAAAYRSVWEALRAEESQNGGSEVIEV